MFTFTVTAETYEQLKQKICEAADVESKDDTTQLSLEVQSVEPELVVPVREVREVVQELPEVVPSILEQAVPVPASSEVDSRGVPWNEKIHASSRGKNKDGSWRTRRGVDESQVKEVEEGLAKTKPQEITRPAWEAQKQAPVEIAPVVVPVVPVIPTPVYVPPLPPPVTQMPIQPASIVTGGHTLETFRSNLVGVIAGLINEKKITPEYVATLCGYFKVGQLWEIFGDEVKVKELFENFAQCGFVTKVG